MVFKIIENFIKNQLQSQLWQTIYYTDSLLRVDLQIEDTINKKIVLIDIKYSMDITANIEWCHHDNMAKYSALRDHITDIMRDGKLYLILLL